MSVWLALGVGLCCGVYLLVAMAVIVYPALRAEARGKDGTRR